MVQEVVRLTADLRRRRRRLKRERVWSTALRAAQPADPFAGSLPDACEDPLGNPRTASFATYDCPRGAWDGAVSPAASLLDHSGKRSLHQPVVIRPGVFPPLPWQLAAPPLSSQSRTACQRAACRWCGQSCPPRARLCPVCSAYPCKLEAMETLSRQSLVGTAALAADELQAWGQLQARFWTQLDQLRQAAQRTRKRRNTAPLRDFPLAVAGRSPSLSSDGWDVVFVASPADVPKSPEARPTQLRPNSHGFYERGACHPDRGAAAEDLRTLLRAQPIDRAGALLQLVLSQGISAACRAEAWAVLSGVADFRYRLRGVSYRRLLLQTPASDHQHAILLDIRRTLIDHHLFSRPHQPEEARPSQAGETRLYNILAAYACLNPRVGYRQGMNFLAATLLTVFFGEEELAFWMFALLMEGYGWAQLFDPRSSGLDHLLDALQRCIPTEVRDHLLRHNMPPSVFAPNWFLTLFSASFECWASVLLIWDLMWLLGPTAVVPLRVAVACLTHFSAAILACPDPVALAQFLHHTVPQAALHRDFLPDLLASQGGLNSPLYEALPFIQAVAVCDGSAACDGAGTCGTVD
eukprot:EG_transcript_6097